ncbi:MAG: GMC family oxidoreductase [Acidobacteria bacterium]|nr:GMC family oxidoreductase [Acidobacteriota bacterium]
MTHYDVIIIGTGAGGGTLAWRLAQSGKKILLLERGGFLPREKENWDSKTVVIENKYRTSETWLDKDGREFHPGIHYYVGGQTKFYGAALVRFRKEEFGELRHFGGVSPAWPIGYEDLAPYYTEAEYLYSVHGERGSDPTEPPADKPYPYPAVSHEPRIQQLFDDLKRAGHRPFPLPIGIQLDEDNPESSRCIRCSTCDGFPCLADAKSDAHVTCVRPAIAKPNVTLVTHAFVSRLETEGSGRAVAKVHVERNGEREVYSGDIVVVSCGAVNSAALLLRSASDRHPRGLANRSDAVGRYYMCHNNSAMLVLSKTPNPTKFQKTLGLNDFYFGAEDSEFPLGHISMLGKMDANVFRVGSPVPAPGFTFEAMAQHSLDFWMTSEDLPDPDNRVIVNDKGGISLHYTENNLEAHTRLVAKFKKMLHKIGCDGNHILPCQAYLGKKIPIEKVAHQCGTVRFGRDPKSSVLDVQCKAHELDNLYVVDASFFPSSNSLNPALTIMANALRVGDHLLERLG